MGITISKPPINLREQLTELKAQQGYEEQQFHFDGLVTNGTFDTDISGWTDNSDAGGAIAWNASGYLDLIYTSGVVRASQDISLSQGAMYAIQFEVVAVPASSGLYIDGAIQANFVTLGVGSHTAYYTSTTTGSANLEARVFGAGTVSIDNFSVYEVDPNDSKVIHTMLPKGWKPLHVFEDGALQREGSAYDYTVEYDGFNYIVKEAVAPLASSSTTVIGVRA